MYDNSRVPSYTNVSSHPYRIQYSRWSLNSQNTGIASGHILPQSTATLPASSFYFPHTQQVKQKLTPHYVNLQTLPPPASSVSSSHLSNYHRPKSTNFHDFISPNQSTFLVHDLRQRYDSKAVVGIVKPMVHQRSYTQLNHNNNNNNNNEGKIPELMTDSYHHSSTHSLQPTSPPSPPSFVIYRSRPAPSYNNVNGQPPMVPRRHSSISNSKCLSSHRSSRTTSTSSSIAAINELSSAISAHEDEQQQQQQQLQKQQQQNNNRIIIDTKRLEMFYASVGTLVKSARSTARLYTTTTRQIANFEDWSCQQFGVPVWIYNTGANLKRTRQIRLLLAHHESCFAIWSCLISDQVEIRIPKENFVTCWLPESSLLVVFKFDHDETCRLFFRHYYEILEYERRKNLANPSALSVDKTIQQPQSNHSTNHKEVPRRYSRLRTISTKQDKEQQFELRRCRSLSKIRTVKKSDISGPINFEHVNHLSSGCHQERPMLGTATLRSLHASMSHLPSNGTLTNRCAKQSKNQVSTLFEPRTTAV